MSSPQQSAVPNSTEDVPQFATVMRGYDRGQVDDYVARLIDFLAEELRQALDRLQAPAPQQPWEGVGERLESMLRLAQEESDAILDRGRAEAQDLIDQARRQREQEVAAAERELGEVSTRRDSVVAELRKVQDVLATLGLRQAVEHIDAAAEATTGSIQVAAPPAVHTTPAEPAPPSDEDDAEATRVIRLPEAANR